MKFYLWRPNGHGEYSIGILAKSKEEAKIKVDEYIKKYCVEKENTHDFSGWGTDYYCLEIYETGQIMVHEND